MKLKWATRGLRPCDECDAQEDSKHYCLLHGESVKNMDVVCCDEWTERKADLERAI